MADLPEAVTSLGHQGVAPGVSWTQPGVQRHEGLTTASSVWGGYNSLVGVRVTCLGMPGEARVRSCPSALLAPLAKKV